MLVYSYLVPARELFLLAVRPRKFNFCGLPLSLSFVSRQNDQPALLSFPGAVRARSWGGHSKIKQNGSCSKPLMAKAIVSELQLMARVSIGKQSV